MIVEVGAALERLDRRVSSGASKNMLRLPVSEPSSSRSQVRKQRSTAPSAHRCHLLGSEVPWVAKVTGVAIGARR